jgi:hypothetical protein
VILSLPNGPVRLLRAGEERIRRSQARGLSGDDPTLPFRWLQVSRDGRTLSVGVGPIEEGAPDAELWETLIEIR